MITPGIDHIALNVPDLDLQIERLTTVMGLVVEHRFGDFALISDPTNGLKLELGRSEDDQVHFRHLGFRADDVDSAHQHLVDTGMETTEEPHRRDFAAMYTSFLHQQGCVDVPVCQVLPARYRRSWARAAPSEARRPRSATWVVMVPRVRAGAARTSITKIDAGGPTALAIAAPSSTSTAPKMSKPQVP